MLADGSRRDFGQLANYGFASWSRRGHALGRRHDRALAANVPVEVGGVCVVPGDYVYADASGAVILPRAGVRRVIDEAIGIEAVYARFAAEIVE